MKTLFNLIFFLSSFINVSYAETTNDKYDRFIKRNIDFFSDKIFPDLKFLRKKVSFKSNRFLGDKNPYENMYWTEGLKFYSQEKSEFLMDIDDIKIIKSYVADKRRAYSDNTVTFSVIRYKDHYHLGYNYRLYTIAYEYKLMSIMLKIENNKIKRVGYMMAVI